ncbi:MAG TPA: hypothetical protein VHE54_04480 [Puia sp.]|nr:hypothetical protein [Puia sp.]
MIEIIQNRFRVDLYGFSGEAADKNWAKLGHRIGEAGAKAKIELEEKGWRPRLPYLEIYGHWTGDEARLGTELLWSI